MLDYDYELTILGNPKPQGRPRATTIGRHARVYDDPKSAKAKQSMAAVVQQQAPDELLDCPLKVVLHFYFPRPKSHFGTGKNAGVRKRTASLYHTKKPDIDNLSKLAMDALTGIFWSDDSIVCQLLAAKHYSDRPRTEILIKEIK